MKLRGPCADWLGLRLWIVCVYTMLAMVPDSAGQYDPKQWPQVSLSFSESGTLEDIFTAGIRPYRFPGLERSRLGAKHYRVTVKQRDGTILPEFPAEIIEITPLQGGMLSSLRMTRYKGTLDEARGFMLPYLSKEGRSAYELDRFLETVKADHLDYDGIGRGIDNFRVRWSDAGGPRYVVAFRKAFDPVRPLIFFMMIDWSQVRTPQQSRSFYKEPIPPPPGFEEISMQAPKKFGPDSQVDILLAQGKRITGDRLPSSSKLNAPSKTDPTASPAPNREPTSRVSHTPAAKGSRQAAAWAAVVGTLVVLVIATITLKRRG